ncbi:hydroxymethylbilane synthase [Cellulomonas sp. P22]|uniref:hydroxymethylbilane synthase n=1 Tax=Cellulomonas sp. P22 TaxID=3373189 RepID=UPI003788B030
MPTTVRIGTRASTLALTQTGLVAAELARLGDLAVELVEVRTEGDRATGSLATLGGTGVFVTALRDALLNDRCDIAVHSLKDLPTLPFEGIVLGGTPPREDPRDVLCAREGWTLETLPLRARVGTGSPRRAAQLLAVRPDLEVVDIRGNVDTRLGRVAPGDLDAVVLARAGLARLGRLDAVTQEIDPHVMTPAPGQGALAIEVRAPGTPDSLGLELAQALAALDDPRTRLAILAERALLAALEAGCAAPVGALARVEDAPDASSPARIHLDVVVIRTDGSAELRRSASLPLPGPVAEHVSGFDEALRPLDRSGPVALGSREQELRAIALGDALAEELLTAGAARLAAVGPRAPEAL